MPLRLPKSAVLPLPRDPESGRVIAATAGVISEILQFLGITHPWEVPAYTVATVPNAADWKASIIYVSDETGGAVIAFSDGTNWRRVTDRAIVA